MNGADSRHNQTEAGDCLKTRRSTASEGVVQKLMSMQLMTIGQLAGHTRVTPRAIRHYERLGLIEAPLRTDANYRLFDSDSVSRIKFIAKCRSLGFSLPEIADFLHIMEDPDHTCAQVVEVTRQHLDLIDAKLSDLAEMRRTLALIHQPRIRVAARWWEQWAGRPINGENLPVCRDQPVAKRSRFAGYRSNPVSDGAAPRR